MLLLSEQDVDRLVDPLEAIEVAAAAFIAQSTGEQPAPGRLDVRRVTPRAGMLVLASFSPDALGLVKSNMHAYSGEPSTRRTGSLLALWDMSIGEPIALLSSAAFNGHRTASGFAAAARRLSRADAATLVVFGAGQLALPTIQYLAIARPIKRVIIVGRTRERTLAFVTEARRRFEGARFSIEAEGDVIKATSAADIIAAVTSSDTPVFPGDAVQPGTFVILGGANRPTAREADDTLAKRARIYVDHLSGCVDKAGDIRIPLAAKALREDDLREIGSILAHPPQALDGQDIPVFKSIGIATQDMALARHLCERAKRAGVGLQYDLVTGRVGLAS